ncbi:MAG: phosphatase PAP2 family protein [Proteobacteria bacterium]|nr:phosphatase PAP2 family protein [Pseudomonadota bacterium]
MLEIIAKTGLFFSQSYVMASIIIVGFIRKEAIFGRTLFLLAFTLMYNVFLKSIWQAPLPPPLEGWAFPSGHMHCAVVFWGWLAYEFHKVWFYEIAIFILCLVGYGLLYHGFHYPVDILGAFAFGTLSIAIYALLQRLAYFKEKPYRLGFLLAFFGLTLLLLLPPEGRKPHMWWAYGTLIGFTLGWRFSFKPNLASLSNKQMILQLGFTVAGILLLVLITNQFKQFDISTNSFNFIKFLLISFWLAASKAIFCKFQKRGFRQPSVAQQALEK